MNSKTSRKVEGKRLRKSERHQKQFRVVGIGASAGGLEPIIKVLQSLPPSPGLALVVVVHLAPQHRSQISDILRRMTSLEVLEIQNGMKAEVDKVYVIPHNAYISISKGHFKLHPRTVVKGHPEAIDLFLRSLAADQRENSIGIILSGTGTDGSDGIKAIKRAGGITFAQDPKTAKYDGMPSAAIQTDCIDHVLGPTEIIEKIVSKNETTADLSFNEETSDEGFVKSQPSPALFRIFDLLRKRTHVDFSGYKLTTLQRRIQRRMIANQVKSLEDYAGILETQESESRLLFEDIFIHVTEFFRDPQVFQTLRTVVFPSLIKDRSEDVPIRIWIPGCSSGEEAYSIAICLFEVLDLHGLHFPIQIFATDVSDHAIIKARAGGYSKEDVKNVPDRILSQFFEEMKGGYKVKKAIRDTIVFSRHDVTSNPPFARVDLVSCRNVLIYFATELQKKVLPIFHYALKPGGFLLLGKSETPSNFSKLFSLTDKANKVFCKTNNSKLTSFQFPTGHYGTERLELPKRPHQPFSSGLDIQKDVDRIVLSEYSPASVVVDGNAEILQVRGQVNSFLEIPPGNVSVNLMKMIRPELLPSLRLLFQSAKKQNSRAFQEKLKLKTDGKKRSLNLKVLPINPLVPSKDRQYLVLFEDSSSLKKSRVTPSKWKDTQIGKKDAAAKLSRVQEQYIAQLQLELEAMKEHQQSLADEFASAQEELTSANEELQSTNEELQSTNEELETAKEELQAANEELTTTNDELQSRNLELNLANSELEKETKRVKMSEERFRLMVENVKDYAIFMLDPAGRVATWNEGAKRIKGYDQSEIIGQHFSKFYLENEKKSGKPEMELRVAAAEGRFEDEGLRVRKDGSYFWANVVITAVRSETAKNDLLGYVKVTRDLTERKSMEDALRRARDQLESRVAERTRELTQSKNQLNIILRGMSDGIVVRDSEGKFVFVNELAAKLHGFSSIEDFMRAAPNEVYRDLEIIDEKGALLLETALPDRHALAGVADPPEVVLRFRSKKLSQERWVIVKARPVFDESSEAGLAVTIFKDFTDRKRSEDGLKFLDEASSVLASSLDYEHTLSQISWVAVPGVADWCRVDLIDPHTEVLRSLPIVHPDPKKAALANELKQKYPPDPKAERGPYNVIRTGKTEWYPEVSPDMIAASARDERHLEVLSSLHFSSAVIVPIVARGKTLGAITFIMAESNRKYAKEDVAILEELAHRAGIAMDNAFLYQQAQTAIHVRDEFLSIASHELKTPLTSLKLHIQMRKRALATSGSATFTEEKLAKMVSGDEKEIERIARLVEDMLDVTRLQSGKMNIHRESVDLVKLVRDVIARFEPQIQSSGIQVRIDAPDRIIGSWDSYRIEQVFINLLTNAIKYGSNRPIRIVVEQKGSKAILAVRDEGIGIAKKDQGRIFQQFERVVHGTHNITGLGLGLYIVQEIVQAHGGTVQVHSEVGQGSEFVVELPMYH